MWLFLFLPWLSFAADWNVNDLSILLPLPKAAEIEKMLAPESGLLPKEAYFTLPTLAVPEAPEDTYKTLKVLSVRIDPCFVEGTSPCEKQVRLVWQPVINDGGGVTTRDAAVHTFYSFNDETFAALLQELEAIKRPIDSNTLGVHPILAAEGYDGPFWQALSHILLKYCGPKNLHRATAMTVNARGNIWTFSGFNIVDGKAQTLPIPRISQTIQSFFVNLKHTVSDFQAVINPAPAGETYLLTLLRNSLTAKTEMGESQIQDATRAALRIENPELANPGNTDCVSCHAVHVIPTWSLKNFSWDWDHTFAQELTHLTAPKPENPPEGVNVLRAFGYFKQTPVVSRRMANEAKEVIEHMKLEPMKEVP